MGFAKYILYSLLTMLFKKGILYDRGYSCDINSSFDVTRPTFYSGQKIALVQKGEGIDCDFYTKVYNSQLDGAVGVIIYDSIPFREDDQSGSMVRRN